MAKITAGFEYSDSELLALVNEAIATIVHHNQSYEIRGRVYTRADLADLVRLRDALTASAAREASGGGLAINFARLRRRP